VSQPALSSLYDVIDSTWPAEEIEPNGPWLIRRGGGGGSRVSAATCTTSVTGAQIDHAVQAMTEMDQTPLFMVRDGQDDFDDQLGAKGFVVKDPVTLYSIDLSDCDWPKPPRMSGFSMWPPLAVCLDIWEAGEIGPARVAVMDRAALPKTVLFGRANDTPAGTAFVAMHQRIAMLHALEVLSEQRRHGLGRELMWSAATWAKSNGATHLTVLVTKANDGANRLYRGLGMTSVGSYHYRIKQ